MECCIGCGNAAQAHPFVGVGRSSLATGEGALVAHPVCAACHVDPSHRTLSPALKVTFFPREHASVAVVFANALDAQSKRGEDLGIGR